MYNISSSEATRNIGHKIFNNTAMCEGCATRVSRTMTTDVHHSDLRISFGFRSMSVCAEASWAGGMEESCVGVPNQQSMRQGIYTCQAPSKKER